jgi:hypothetical protein
MIDLLFLASGRPEFTRASLAALLANTNWALVNEFLVIRDKAIPEVDEDLFFPEPSSVTTLLFPGRWGSPVAIMNWHLSQSGAPIFAKIDNDVIVPPGWLDQCVEVMEKHPDLDLLGIEPPDSRKPHFSQPDKEQPTRALELAPGPARYVPCDAIGGIGLMRRSAFDGPDEMFPHSTYGGFTDWQLRHPEVTRGWIAPALKLFLLDRLPMAPWQVYSREYIARGWQRKWRDYTEKDSHLWEWWLKKTLS